MNAVAPQPYAAFYVRVGDKGTYGIDWTGWLANFWAAGVQMALTNTVRPSKANGFEYVCTTAGQSGAQEPAWPAVVGATVADGSAVWTCEAASNNSLSTTVASILWQPPAGIVVTAPAVVGQIALALVDASGAVAGIDYSVLCVATMADTQTKTGLLKFKVR